MLATVVSRLLAAVSLFAIVAVGTFLLLGIAPQHPEVYILGQDATPASIAALRKELGLDRNIFVQLGSWVGNVLHGDLGTSWVSGRSVTSMISRAIPPTAMIMGLALVITIIVSLLLAVPAAVFQGSFIDRFSTAVAAILHGSPSFWIGILFAVVFAVQLGWFPATGFVDPAEDLFGSLRSVFLPALALGLSGASVVTRFLRTSLVRELSREHVRTAVAQGFGRWEIINRRVLRNSLGPSITQLGFQIVVMLSASVVIERVFAIPGLGDLAVNSAVQQDVPMLMGVVLTFALIVLIVNLIVDISYQVVNPRLRNMT